MPWQRAVWDVLLEVQSEAAGDPEPGAWAYDDGTITVERQAGKTTGLRPLVVHRCGKWPMTRAFMTAQKRDKARARWLDATDDLLSSPLGLDVKRKVSIGHEVLEWLGNRSRFEPFAPNEDDMHGESPDLVVVDELWAFDAERARAVIGAYRPGFLTKNAQAIKLSTAGTSESWWLNTARRTGRAAVENGVRLGTFYYEHSLPDVVNGTPLEDLTDAQLVQACIDNHPARGITLRPAALWSAWAEMDGDRNEFLRAYGNRTAENTADVWQAIAEETWLRGGTPDRIPGDARVSLGVEVDPERRESSVSAGVRVHGRMVTELLRRDVGTRWVAGYVAGVAERQAVAHVGVVDAGPARDIADELERAGVPLLRISLSDYAAACGRRVDELAAGTWGHNGHPDLTAAAKAAGWRNLGRNRAFHGTREPITALVADTVAGWSVDHAPEPETPRPPFWMG